MGIIEYWGFEILSTTTGILFKDYYCYKVLPDVTIVVGIKDNPDD